MISNLSSSAIFSGAFTLSFFITVICLLLFWEILQWNKSLPQCPKLRSKYLQYLLSSSVALILSPWRNLLCCNCQDEWWIVSVSVCLIAHLYTHTLTHKQSQSQYVCELTECASLPTGTYAALTHFCGKLLQVTMRELTTSSLTSWSLSPG